jgi:hypothetical protein
MDPRNWVADDMNPRNWIANVLLLKSPTDMFVENEFENAPQQKKTASRRRSLRNLIRRVDQAAA